MKRKHHLKGVPLSFSVEEIRNHFAPFSHVEVTTTVLKCHTSKERLTIRGYYWPVGTKVDFREILK